MSVYVPTTPNPTGGYFIMLPRRDVIELDMDVDEALKYIISMGVALPTPRANRTWRATARRAGTLTCERIPAAGCPPR